MLMIIAGNHKQAYEHARINKLKPYDWVLLHKENQLRGLTEVEYIKVGTWWDLKEIREIEDYIRVIETRNKS